MSGPETETAEDIWDMALFGHRGRLSFTAITQPWLRQTARIWAAADLPRRRGRSGGDKTRHYISSLALRARIKDKRISALVKSFLKSGVLTELGDREETLTGTPQGGLCEASHKEPYEQRWVMRSVRGVALVGGQGAPQSRFRMSVGFPAVGGCEAGVRSCGWCEPGAAPFRLPSAVSRAGRGYRPAASGEHGQ